MCRFLTVVIQLLIRIIYTCIVGKYDTLLEPEIVMPNCDYICFSDTINQDNYKIWKILPIPYTNSNATVKSRYVKFFPHKVLQNYTYSLYIDGNIVIKLNLVHERLIQLINLNCLIAINKHPQRNCIFDEIKICSEKGFINKSEEKTITQFLESHKYPRGIGLYENNLIFRKHNETKLVNSSEIWWNLFISYAKRDQLYLKFVFWLHEVECCPFFEDDFNIRNSDLFEYHLHAKPLTFRIKKNINKFINKFFTV